METNRLNNRTIPKEFSDRWQKIIDLIANLLDIPVALLMKFDDPMIEVLKTNDRLSNPYTVGDRQPIDGFFCQEVIENNDYLMVKNALDDSKWAKRQDVKLGLQSYLGYPIQWPDGQTFGTLCVLDFKARQFTEEAKHLLNEFKELIEAHLSIINQQQVLANEIKAKEQLENKFNITLRSIGDAVITTDIDGEIVMLNPTAEQLTGWNETEAIGQPLEKVFKIVNPRTEEPLENPVKKVLSEGIVLALANDTMLIDKHGHRRQIANTAASIKHDDGQVEGVIIVFSDVTQQYKNKEQLKRTKKQYQQLAESVNAILWEYNIQTDRWDYVAPQAHSILGYAPEEWTGLDFWIHHIHPADHTWAKDYCLTHTAPGQEHIFEYRFYHKNGSLVWMKDQVSVEFEYGTPVKLRGLMIDITDVKTIEEHLKEENKWLESLFKNATDAIAMFDQDHCIIDVNQVFLKKFKYDLQEIMGLDLDAVMNMGRMHSANSDVTIGLLNGYYVELEETRYDKYGNPYEFLIKGIPVVVDGKTIGGYAIYMDISERKRKEETIRYLSLHDNLTDLYNRNFLEEEIERLDVKRNLPIAVIMVDLNGLKIINDTYGHQKGDEFLVKTSEVLKDVFREDDIIARWGGDEFVIFLPTTEQAPAEKILSRIKENKKEVFVGENESIPISLAVGLAFKEEPSEEIYEAFQAAEDEMYKDKLLQENSVKSHITNTLLKTLQQKSEETESHVKRMSELAKAIGHQINLSLSDQEKLSLLATLHDIGKTIIPKDILSKPGNLNTEEWEEIKKHPETGYRICAASQEFSHIALEVLSHHEHWDGTGYPKGLKGKEIPLLARILSIVDAYDVMINGRSYKKALTTEEALIELKRCAGSQFDPQLVDIFITIMGS